MRIGDEPVHKWRAGKARSLFQYLLVHRGRVVLRDKLHDVLWPDSEWSPSSSSLKVAMHAVRQVLRADAAGGGAHGVRILHEDFGYVLHADDVWVDVDEFEALIEAGRMADKSGDSAGALRAYAAAIELYQGDFLAGETADWVVEQREWCKSLALRALDRLSAEALATGAFDELVRWCRRIIDIDPYREPVYRMLMDLHGRFGELGAVRRWHELCVRRLAEELGVPPAEETEEVYVRAMRSGARGVRAVPSAPARPRHLRTVPAAGTGPVRPEPRRRDARISA
ncbi:response regulator receiver and SARP domain-containing protein [Actinomadura verrucosospora]|uniref:Response regulator receiver and SARP domain-containing protein n=1 Tax=Actinomadura verrucosospora TaxID=46165 RepID=A0A7D3ZJN1_ACTVE|nr:response regulator receiver and SARP domain-containing protein [Actinomadura verrucosospora]